MNEKIIKEINEKYSTPAYIFDINTLNKRVKYLKSSLPNKVELCYAIKANTFIVEDIQDEVGRFEVCSPGEYEICKAKEIEKDKILISGVYKDTKSIMEMLEDGITSYTIESMEQFELFRNIKTDRKIQLLIRLTSGNQFGIGETEVEEIIKNRDNYTNLDIKGIQYFSGTQKISLKNIRREIEYVDEFIERLENEYNYKAEELEFGGGFPVFYFENQEFDEDEYLKEFSNIINDIKFNGNIIIELGRSIAASCGYYLTKVVDLKKNKEQNYAIVDGGMNHIVYYGQSMAMKVPKLEVYPKREGVNTENWNLCGSLCTINDILIKQYPVSNLKIGDIFIFKYAGAYCMTEGISLFLSRDLPQVLKLKDGEIIQIRDNKPTFILNM